jgi:adenylate cyclase
VKKHRLRIAMGLLLVLALLAHVADRLRIPFIDNLEAIIYDARLRLTMPGTVDNRIIILDIDEKSLIEPERGGEGRWPWPRDRLALLLDKLFDHYQIAVVGFDVVFAESDNSSGIRVLEKLGDGELKGVPQFQSAFNLMKPRLDYDQLFAASMKDRAVVLGYTFLGEQATKGMLPAPVVTASDFLQQKPPQQPPPAAGFSGYTGNLAAFQKNAAAGGHFNPLPDNDGITRRVPMLAKVGDAYYEPLSLAMVRLLAGSPPVKPIMGDEGISTGYVGLEGVRIGKTVIPVDQDSAALVPYRGPRGSFAYYSLVDVLNERVDVADLRGKIALVGASAPGLLDLRATPVDPVYPGVEIHANLIAGMLDENIKHKPAYATGAEFALILFLGLAMAIWLPVLSPQQATLVTLSVLLLVLASNLGIFHFAHIVLPLASALVMILLLFTLNMAYGFFVEARGRKQITGLFGQYVPPEVVEEIARDPDNASMEGESREMTVLFTDVRGFTTISEGLDPKALSALMNEFLTPLTEVIYKHRGTIDKYMGDCIMAFWGAPLRDAGHARSGVLAGLEMQRTLKAMQPIFRAKNWPEIRIGVGLNSGRMSVGNMGSRVRLAYTVMGDAVNLASRLEGITKEYGADIIVGEDTKNAVPDVVYREIDRVRVKGKDTAVSIYEPLGLDGEVPKAILDDVALFHEALELYRKQEWDMAELRLLRLKTISPDVRLYDTFLERVAFLRSKPPGQGWDGAFTFQSK